MTTISVLIPTRLRPQFLTEAIESVERQTYPRSCVQIVVVHDGIDGPTQTPRGANQYWMIPKAGLSAAVNAAFAKSLGTYVTVLADDDLMHPHKLALLSSVLDEHRDVTAAYALAEHVSGLTNRGVPSNVRQWLRGNPLVTWETIKRGQGCMIHGTAILHRRAAWLAAGPWDETLWAGEEWEYHLRLLSKGGCFKGVESITDIYRIHPRQKNSQDQRRRKKDRQALIFGISQKYLSMARLP